MHNCALCVPTARVCLARNEETVCDIVRKLDVVVPPLFSCIWQDCRSGLVWINEFSCLSYIIRFLYNYIYIAEPKTNHMHTKHTIHDKPQDIALCGKV